MCGITGFVDFKERSSRPLLEKMNRSLAHRGPDGEGYAFIETHHAQVGLGHRRLSIIDLSEAGRQPMEFDGLTFMFNGEIYNYQEIKDELIQKGHSFKSTSDTEMIMHAYREWGMDCLQRFVGMFAMVMHDAKTNELVCIRDRAGVKPFYYYYHDGLFLFSSELKAFHEHPGFVKELNREAAASFLQYGYVSSPHCIFNYSSKLPAAHFLKLDLAKQEYKIQPYWNVYDYYNAPKLSIGIGEAISETEKILKKAFDYRLVADVPVGVFLSGGYDSSCVTALLQKDRTDKIKTFTIGTTDPKLDEAPFAREIAKRLGTDHTEYYCTHREALDIIPDLPFYFDEPFADSSAIPTILVSRLARKKVTVALSADAGDEVFAGYNRYDYISRYGKKIKAIPYPARKLAAVIMENVSSEKIPYWRGKRNFHSRYDKIKNLLRNPDTSELLRNLSQVYTPKEIKAIFLSPVEELRTLHNSNELKKEFYEPLSFMMAVDYQTYMVDDILQKVDRASMSTSLEGREPFLDQHIIEWAARLPSEHKYYKGQKKYILKQIVHQYIPKEMMERPKMGFGIPVEDWLSDELKPLVLAYCSGERIKKQGLFDTAETDRLLADFFGGRKEKYLKVWYLLMFQMWHERWFPK